MESRKMRVPYCKNCGARDVDTEYVVMGDREGFHYTMTCCGAMFLIANNRVPAKPNLEDCRTEMTAAEADRAYRAMAVTVDDILETHKALEVDSELFTSKVPV